MKRSGLFVRTILRLARKRLIAFVDLLGRYAFDGVFLDKFRFPSPANGLDEVLSCFCVHCRRSAATIGLDLGQVARYLQSLAEGSSSLEVHEVRSDEPWFDVLLGSNELLPRFLKFRRDSITALVDETHQKVSSLGRKHLARPLFSRALRRRGSGLQGSVEILRLGKANDIPRCQGPSGPSGSRSRRSPRESQGFSA